MNCFYAAQFDDHITPSWTDFVLMKMSAGVKNPEELTFDGYCKMVEEVHKDYKRAEQFFPRFFEFFVNLVVVDELFMERGEKKGLDAMHFLRYKELITLEKASLISNEVIRQTCGVDLHQVTAEFLKKQRECISKSVTDDEATQIQIHNIFDEELHRICKR